MRLVRSSLLLFLLAVLFITCRSSRISMNGDTHNADPRWGEVDSLANIGQYASALERTNALMSEAQASGDWRMEFRAWANRSLFQGRTGMDPDSSLIQLEERATSAATPLKQVLYSVVADGWWNYYQQDRWQIMERTNLEVPTTDPKTWTQATFIRKVIEAYTASLSDEDSLKTIPVEDLGDLLQSTEYDRGLRPTLYDLLAHRALAVYTNTETRLTEPAWRFKLDDPRDLDLFEPFVYRKLEHRDSTAWEFLALQHFQSLERSHLNDDTPDALVDVMLQRLAFVKGKSTVSNKEELYLGALETLRTRLVNDTSWAEVTVAAARWHFEQGSKYERLAGDRWKWEKRTARDLCNEAISRFPGSFGAKNAAALKSQLEKPSFHMQCEEAVLPNDVSTIALSYTNTQKVWLRVVRDPAEVNADNASRKDRLVWLLGQKAAAEWNVELPDDGDLNEHMIELSVRELPAGRYTVIVSGSEMFHAEQSLIAHATFWSTRFMFSERTSGMDLDVLIVDRWTGAPIQGVMAEAYVWTRSGDRRFNKLAEFMTDLDGRVRAKINDERGQLIWSLTTKDDAYVSGSTWLYDRNNSEPQASLRTYLFTDRAIYRPGQEVFFKGIVTSRKGKSAEVKSGYSSTVRLYDVNGEEVDTIRVQTDEYGSFQGRFKAPQGALTGSMRIQEEHGSRSIQVEEYKRPTFEVLFDPIASAAKLGQEATVTGQARSYAGVPLDGASVQWTVKRGVRMPWWCGWGWRGLPWGQETEIANGEAVCDAEGKFSVAFTATADRAFPEDADPTFNYTVEVAAIDITGETQSANTTLSAAYRSIDIAINVSDAIDRNVTDSIDIRVKNLNGQDMDVPMDVRIVELVPPTGAPRRERLWERPDRILEGELQTTHLKDDPTSWPELKERLVRLDHRANGMAMATPGIDDWTVGMYRIEVSATDTDGKQVKVNKLVTVFDTMIQNTGFVNEAFHVEPITVKCEPGDKAVLLLSSALPEGRVLMEVERDGRIAVSKRLLLKKGQQRVDLPVLEGDRGGFAVHFLCVERGRVHNTTQRIEVPWSNKELQVEWMSFRDKLLPGSKEEWRLRISGPKKEKVAAQLLAVMYDASLDHFIQNNWSMFQWPVNYTQHSWGRSEPGGTDQGHSSRPNDPLFVLHHSYPCLRVAFTSYGGGRGRFRTVACPSFGGDVDNMEMRSYSNARMDSDAPRGLIATDGVAEETLEITNGIEQVPPSTQPESQPVRSDFRETAFFFPDLLTDLDGSIVLRFTAPDALTRWKVMGLAHTKDLKIAQFAKEATTSKPLMVVPNLPRFLREGDRITLTAKINVLDGDPVEGTAKLELFDPRNNTDVNSTFGVLKNEQAFLAGPGQSANVAWTITVPAGADIVSVRITANAAGMGDGEERPLPILTDRVLVTESLPLAISKAGTKTFKLEKLIGSSSPFLNSSTLQHKSLELEYTPNPAWYAVQALPYLMEFPHECAEQTFSRYYANRLATHIVEVRPAVKKVFKEWGKGEAGNEEAFLSALEKNPELKNVLLEETPWVVNAKDEHERKRRMALFFDLQRMSSEEAVAMKKLRDMQLQSGAWPWWSGMRPSRYITQHIVAGFGHLETLKAGDTRPDGATEQMLRNAVRWLDVEFEKDYNELVRRSTKESLAKYVPNATDIHFLYARSFFLRWPINGATRTALDFYLRRAKETWLSNGLQQQAMLVLAFDRLDDAEHAQLILKSLSERATQSEELGMYWKGFNSGYDWWSFPTETHALLIEAYHEVAKDPTRVNGLKQYLLKLKQTTDWKTTKATSEACYALLLTGDDWLEPKDGPVITVGGDKVVVGKQEAGTDYFTKSWIGNEVKSDMGEVKVTTTSDGVQWGALHWQYLEHMDKITSHESPFSINKQVMLHAQTDAGAQLIALDKARTLMPGDKLTIRIELRTDRYVDYVHLKDLRAAGLEPTEAISGYKWQGGLGYYQSIRDAGMHFFFDRIAPGTYVFEYDLRVTHAGDFSNGITTAMCMYAPEFSSHSEGVRVKTGE